MKKQIFNFNGIFLDFTSDYIKLIIFLYLWVGVIFSFAILNIENKATPIVFFYVFSNFFISIFILKIKCFQKTHFFWLFLFSTLLCLSFEIFFILLKLAYYFLKNIILAYEESSNDEISGRVKNESMYGEKL
jgi:hypothetical protein